MKDLKNPEIADCLKCIHRKQLSHSSHSMCNHPEFKEINEDKLGKLLSILGKRVGNLKINPKTIIVEGHPHGIDNGWFNHPFNFDPIWLKKCTGFTRKDNEKFD